MKKKQIIKVLKLFKEQTRAEIMARYAPFRNFEFGDYYKISQDKHDEIREVLYGTSNLVQLGEEWGLLKPRMPDNVRKKKLKKLMEKENETNTDKNRKDK